MAYIGGVRSAFDSGVIAAMGVGVVCLIVIFGFLGFGIIGLAFVSMWFTRIAERTFGMTLPGGRTESLRILTRR